MTNDKRKYYSHLRDKQRFVNVVAWRIANHSYPNDYALVQGVWELRNTYPHDMTFDEVRRLVSRIKKYYLALTIESVVDVETGKPFKVADVWIDDDYLTYR